ncbi:AAA family ATPase [Halanaerobium salsuginis]|jgi:adenylate kinase family enzyme|uniref:Adenylate kinase n=1 Tax=Halanaerobium salsuginis TaxID=29563 RepID=A0A1I4I9H2_9FIRM|nr:AAA family ATPase [Halanaerobium salsuginis]SFL50727.1 Adenylate kinase [Halanaerobium salsuginis]
MLKIHILGPSGSGTTTLGKAISQKYGLAHFDADNYFWKQTTPPFQKVRSIAERRELLSSDLTQETNWLISGSLCGWGDIFMAEFNLVIYLWAPITIRLDRLKKREQKRFGSAVLPGGKMYQRHLQFLDSAARYDYDYTEFRNKRTHLEWLQRLNCPILKIEEVKPISEMLLDVKNIIAKNDELKKI